jgi:hypothetical protein
MGSRALYFNNQPVTITLASLPNGAFAVSSAIDNSTNKFISADIQIKIKTGAGIPAFPNRPTIAVFMVRSADGGVTFDDANDNAQLVDVFQMKNSATTYVVTADTSNIGQLPEFWKLVIKNKTGVAFDSTPSNFNVVFTGKKLEATANFV